MGILNIPTNNQVHTKTGTPGQHITITAVAKEGYEFDHWTHIAEGQPGRDNPVLNYLVKPNGNELEAKFKDKDLGAIRVVEGQNYTINSNDISVNSPSEASDYTIQFNFEEGSEWAHEVRVSNLDSSEYQIVSHTKYGVTIKILGNAIRKIQEGQVEFIDRFGRKSTATFQAYSPSTYTVSTSMDGAEGSITKSPSTPVEAGTRVRLTAPAVDRKNFVGWFEGQDKLGESLELEIVVNSNRTIVARYEDVPFQVHYITARPDGLDPGLQQKERMDVYGFKRITKTQHSSLGANDWEKAKQMIGSSFDAFGDSYDRSETEDYYVLAVPLKWAYCDTSIVPELFIAPVVDSYWTTEYSGKTTFYCTGPILVFGKNSTYQETERGLIVRKEGHTMQYKIHDTENWADAPLEGSHNASYTWFRLPVQEEPQITPGVLAIDTGGRFLVSISELKKIEPDTDQWYYEHRGRKVTVQSLETLDSNYASQSHVNYDSIYLPSGVSQLRFNDERGRIINIRTSSGEPRYETHHNIVTAHAGTPKTYINPWELDVHISRGGSGSHSNPDYGYGGSDYGYGGSGGFDSGYGGSDYGYGGSTIGPSDTVDDTFSAYMSDSQSDQLDPLFEAWISFRGYQDSVQIVRYQDLALMNHQSSNYDLTRGIIMWRNAPLGDFDGGLRPHPLSYWTN